MTTRTFWEGMQLHMLHVAHKAGSFPSCHCSSKSSVRIMHAQEQTRAAQWKQQQCAWVHTTWKWCISRVSWLSLL